jgi:hypothetical protein
VRIKSLLDLPTAVLSRVATNSRGSAHGGASAGSASLGTAEVTELSLGADYRPIRPNPGLTETGLDFGILTRVTVEDDVVTLHVGGFRFNAEESTFVLDPDASLQAEESLRNDPSPRVSRQTLTRTQFVRNTARLEAEHRAPLVWLRHGGPNGHVTALAEQYVPVRSADQIRMVS